MAVTFNPDQSQIFKSLKKSYYINIYFAFIQLLCSYYFTWKELTIKIENKHFH